MKLLSNSGMTLTVGVVIFSLDQKSPALTKLLMARIRNIEKNTRLSKAENVKDTHWLELTQICDKI